MLDRPKWVQATGRNQSLLWLDKNENVDPVYKEFIDETVIPKLTDCAFYYPDLYELYRKMSVHFNVEIESLFLSAGSDGVIRSVFERFVSPGDKVLYINPTFAMYSVYCQIYKAEPRPVDYTASAQGPELTLSDLILQIKQVEPKLVCVPNPNSPTGTVYKDAEIFALAQTCDEMGSLLMIDEAYYPFYPNTAIGLIEKFKNIVITRTFSKAWGLAGARVGVAIGSYNLINKLHQIRPMYEIGNLGAMMIYHALDYEQQMLASVARINEGKLYFQNRMKELGYNSFESHGNFLHINFGEDVDLVHEALGGLVLYRKQFSHDSLKPYSRFTAAPVDIMSRVSDKIASIKQKELS